MRAKPYYHFQNYKNVVSNTVPGRCYSIGELLQRVLRGQPLPMVGKYEEDKDPIPESDEAIELDTEVQMRSINKAEKAPDVDRDFDIIEASETKENIDQHIKDYKGSKRRS